MQPILSFEEIRSSNLSLLYVEDDEDLRRHTTTLFSSLFSEVDSCANGREALIKLTARSYDLLITDITMPLMDGLELIKQIRDLNPTQHILIISAYSDDKYLLNSIELGVDGYILKPFNLEELQKRLSNIVNKIVEERNRSNLELSYKEQKRGMDNLTKAYSYNALMERLNEGEPLSMLLLNIDHFSNINEGYGFDVGDQLLCEAGRMLLFIKREEMDLYRFNSDEFVLLQDDLVENDYLRDVAESIISFFAESEVELFAGASMYISFSIAGSKGYGVGILNQAKMALKELREFRRGAYKLYDSKSPYLHRQQSNIYWIQKIKEFINDSKLVTYFQPIVNNKTDKIEKYECLVRINDEGTLISPLHFLQAAKITGVLPHITRSTIKKSFETFCDTEYEFSINITADDLHMNFLHDALLSASEKYSIDPGRVVLEILEDVATLNEDTILEQLYELREEGFKIAIDDFGSQSSNLSRLLEFSPDYLKIDGSFIRNITHDEKSRIITEAIVLLAHKSNIKVVAEFVHSKEVQDTILELGIDYSQGHFFGAAKEEIE